MIYDSAAFLSDRAYLVPPAATAKLFDKREVLRVRGAPNSVLRHVCVWQSIVLKVAGRIVCAALGMFTLSKSTLYYETSDDVPQHRKKRCFANSNCKACAALLWKTRVTTLFLHAAVNGYG